MIPTVDKIGSGKIGTKVTPDPEDFQTVSYKVDVKKGGFLQKAMDFIRKTAAGQNLAGKILEQMKSIVVKFLPFGRQIKNITDLIGDKLKLKSNHSKMAKAKELKLFDQIKHALKSPESHAAIGFVVMIVAYFFHFDISTGQIISNLTEVITALGAVYTAVFHVITLFHKQAEAN